MGDEHSPLVSDIWIAPLSGRVVLEPKTWERVSGCYGEGIIGGRVHGVTVRQIAGSTLGEVSVSMLSKGEKTLITTIAPMWSNP
jgi:hypothetical protein